MMYEEQEDGRVFTSWRSGKFRYDEYAQESEPIPLELPFAPGERHLYSDVIKPQIKNGIRFQELTGRDIFGNDNPLHVEIGMGNGEFLAHYAAETPDENFLGFEVFKKIFYKAQKRAENLPTDNIRVIHFDADFFVRLLKDGSVKSWYVNFPDPWPKKRHNKRRLLKTDFINMLTDKLPVGGLLHIATDHDDYAQEIMENLKPVTRLQSVFETQWVDHLVDYHPTKYYRKFAVHTGVYFFRMERIS